MALRILTQANLGTFLREWPVQRRHLIFALDTISNRLPAATPDKVDSRVGTPPRAPWSGSDPAQCGLRRIFFATSGSMHLCEVEREADRGMGQVGIWMRNRQLRSRDRRPVMRRTLHGPGPGHSAQYASSMRWCPYRTSSAVLDTWSFSWVRVLWVLTVFTDR